MPPGTVPASAGGAFRPAMAPPYTMQPGFVYPGSPMGDAPRPPAWGGLGPPPHLASTTGAVQMGPIAINSMGIGMVPGKGYMAGQFVQAPPPPPPRNPRNQQVNPKGPTSSSGGGGTMVHGAGVHDPEASDPDAPGSAKKREAGKAGQKTACAFFLKTGTCAYGDK